MSRKSVLLLSFLTFGLTVSLMVNLLSAQQIATDVKFQSLDRLEVSGKLFRVSEDKTAPFILLCHQAGWSRGEYDEIAPKLNAMGFNCLAIDQRSGGQVNEVKNETAARAAKAGKGVTYADAEQDIIAGINFAKENYADGKLILWGSSYSSALALRIAGESPDLVDGVLAFAPGEYFSRFGKPEDWITSAAGKIEVPTFITSAKSEHRNWKSIYEAIPGTEKAMFLPKGKGKHGSSALWKKSADQQEYWDAVIPFLQQFKSH